MATSCPPNAAKLVAKAKKCKGAKTVEAVCDLISENASWCDGKVIDESIMKVLLDATDAMAIVHKRYENCEMAEIARKMFNGEEDDWGEIQPSDRVFRFGALI